MYKYLVMQISSTGSAGFLTESLWGSMRCTRADTNVTKFSPHDFGGGHDNDFYWNSLEELLVGFCNWYTRSPEKNDHNMTNRLYHATDTHRFFKVKHDLFINDDEASGMTAANNDLKSYEITEDEFIKDMIGSYAWEAVSRAFPTNYTFKRKLHRENPKNVHVNIVYNEDTDTWCWSSDYRSKDEYQGVDHLDILDIYVPIGYNYEKAVEHISTVVVLCEYRFGGNDAYHKRKELKLKENK